MVTQKVVMKIGGDTHSVRVHATNYFVKLSKTKKKTKT